MNEFYAESFMIACEKGIILISGNLDEAKRMVSQGVDLNHIDKSGNNGYFQAAKTSQLHVLHYLHENEAILLDVVNKDECTPLHLACDNGKFLTLASKEMMLFFIFNGIDVNVKNKDNKKAGEGHADSKMFMNKILEEVAVNFINQCFQTLNPTQKKKLISIFREIDFDDKQCIDFEKAFKFNKFMEENVNDNMASKDANDFINSCAICNKTTVSLQFQVNLDEWLFSFAKLATVDQETFEKFITEYDSAVDTRGKFADFVR